VIRRVVWSDASVDWSLRLFRKESDLNDRNVILDSAAAAAIAAASSSVAWSQCNHEYDFIPAPPLQQGSTKRDGVIRDFHESLHAVGVRGPMDVRHGLPAMVLADWGPKR
jgi:hypothetical protein